MRTFILQPDERFAITFSESEFAKGAFLMGVRSKALGLVLSQECMFDAQTLLDKPLYHDKRLYVSCHKAGLSSQLKIFTHSDDFLFWNNTQNTSAGLGLLQYVLRSEFNRQTFEYTLPCQHDLTQLKLLGPCVAYTKWPELFDTSVMTMPLEKVLSKITHKT